MGSVRLESISKVFKETTAVDDISLEIDEGEFFSLLGPSGCGKTTTLRMIGGFEDPSAGRIHLSGRDVTAEPPFKRNVNTVFQSYALFPHLDVFENVAYGLKRKKVAGGEIEARVNEMLELVDLPGYGQRKTTQLSGGQQQRVALARALVNRPEVLLLDEPLGALDLKLRKQMQIELKRIQSEVGITFIYVTHDQEEAMTMSNRIAVMNAGKIEQLGPPQEVYELPATAFVASFLGASNLLEGEAAGAEGSWANVRLLTGDVVRVPAGRLPVTDGPVTIGIRPEKLTLDASGSPEGTSNAVKATILVSTYTGVSTDYECKTDDGARIVVYVQNLGGGEDLIPEGSKVHLTWDPEHTFVVKNAGGKSTKEDRDG